MKRSLYAFLSLLGGDESKKVQRNFIRKDQSLLSSGGTNTLCICISLIKLFGFTLFFHYRHFYNDNHDVEVRLMSKLNMRSFIKVGLNAGPLYWIALDWQHNSPPSFRDGV